MEAYKANKLPLDNGVVDCTYFLDALIDATSKLEVYKEKIKDSKLDSSWFMPMLQHKEALESSKLEGTQATLDGVFINQIAPSDEDQNINEVFNYFRASEFGERKLLSEKFSNDMFREVHSVLMQGNVRKPNQIGKYRTEQNYIGKNQTVIFVPPKPADVPDLMDNLISYINAPSDSLRPLVRVAIIHAQFETIHPFMDGNGRVGRMLIPLYMFYAKQIELPCFFISEALEHDKYKYYDLLNGIRVKNDWNSWIKYFLETVAKQCEKYISIVSEINKLYDKHIGVACKLTKSTNAVPVIRELYKNPITTAKNIVENTGLPLTSVNRLLGALVEKEILVTDGSKRNIQYICYELLNAIR